MGHPGNIKRFFYGIVVWAVLFQHGLIAQNPTGEELGSPVIRNYSTEEYNFDTQNWSIIQDHRGVMYIGNNSGVIEYDGRQWRLITPPNNSVVLDLALHEKVVYVAAFDEFGYLACDSVGEIQYVSLLDRLDEEYHGFNYVEKIIPADDGVYFLTKDLIFHYYENKISVIKADLLSGYGFSIYEEPLVINRNPSGIYRIYKDKLELLPNTSQFDESFGKYVLLPYKDKKLLIATEKEGLYIYNFNDFLQDEFYNTKPDIKPFKNDISGFLNQYQLYSGIQIAPNLYAFGTLKGGIIFTDNEGRLIRLVNQANGLQNDDILNFYLDRYNDLWVALNNGIARIEINSPITLFNELNGLEGIVLSTIKHNNTRYIGNIQGIYYLSEYSRNVDKAQRKFLPVENNTQAPCWDFFHLDNHHLLASGEMALVNIKNKNAKNLFSVGQINCFYQDKSIFSDYFFMGLNNGVSCVRVSGDSILHFEEAGRIEGIQDPVMEITSDKEGNIWLSTGYKGIVKVTFEDNDIQNSRVERYGIEDGLPQLGYNYIYNIDGELKIATQKGIYKIENSGNSYRFVPDSSFGDMFVNQPVGVYEIFTNHAGKRWIRHDNGITELTKKEDGTFRVDNKSFNQIPKQSIYKVFKEKDNVLWISSTEGILYRYDCKVDKKFDVTYHALIRNVTLGKDSAIFKGTFYARNKKKDEQPDNAKIALSQQKQMIPKIESGHNSIIFEYTSTYYRNETEIMFQYILDGFTDEWSDWTEETKKEYTYLREGKYTFKVRAKNVFGIVSKPAEYSFIVLPPWYRTIYAYLVYTIAGVLLLIGVIKLYSRRLIIKNIRLEEQVRQRTAEILAQSEKLEMTNRELEKLSIVASRTDNAVLIMDAQGNFEWVNEGYTRMFGFTIEELIKKRSKNIIGPATPEEVKTNIKKCIEKKETVIYELQTRNANGLNIWVQVTLTPILDEKNNIAKLVAIDSDITKVKEAEQKISHQRDELELQNHQIKSSIQYARTIQKAILPMEQAMRNVLDYFVLYRPKDIVSGDFYWFAHIKNNDNGDKDTDMVFIAAVDCTGHGVPGAFMSMIGNSLLNEIVKVKKVYEPKQILEILDESIRIALNQDQTDNHDGMDVCLCRLEAKRTHTKVIFSGAKRPLYYTGTDYTTMELLKGDRKSIGGIRTRRKDLPFTNKEILLKKGDTIYLTTDGIIDQNAPDRRRFGSRRMCETLFKHRRHSMRRQKAALAQRLDDYQEKEEQRDDITVIGVKIG